MKPVATSLLFALLALPPAALAASRTPTGAVIAGDDGGPFPATFDAIQANVFTPSCALSFCHGAAMSGNMDLREGAAYDMIVNVASAEVPSMDRIEPFDPDASYLVCKLQACPSMIGQQMPLIGGPLDPAIIAVIRDWVLQGAPEFPDVAVDATTWGQVKSAYR